MQVQMIKSTNGAYYLRATDQKRKLDHTFAEIMPIEGDGFHFSTDFSGSFANNLSFTTLAAAKKHGRTVARLIH